MKLQRKMWRLKQQKAYEEELEAQKAKEDAARQEEIRRQEEELINSQQPAASDNNANPDGTSTGDTTTGSDASGGGTSDNGTSGGGTVNASGHEPCGQQLFPGYRGRCHLSERAVLTGSQRSFRSSAFIRSRCVLCAGCHRSISRHKNLKLLIFPQKQRTD